VKNQEYGDRMRIFGFYSMEDLRRLFEASGFEVVEDLTERSNGKDAAWINIFTKALTLKLRF